MVLVICCIQVWERNRNLTRKFKLLIVSKENQKVLSELIIIDKILACVVDDTKLILEEC